MKNIRKGRIKEFGQYCDKLLTIEESAEILNVSDKTIYRFIQKKELKVVKVTSKITRIRFSDLRSFITSHQ